MAGIQALELLADPTELDRVLGDNADRAAAIANATLAKVYDRIGFLPKRKPWKLLPSALGDCGSTGRSAQIVGCSLITVRIPCSSGL